MPCNGEYLNANEVEINYSKVLALLEEVKTGVLPDYFGDGYYEKSYSKANQQLLDHAVAELCAKLSNYDPHELSKCSLELQIWWRDHQKADIERVKKKMDDAARNRAISHAMAKLTPEEQELLGLS